MDAIPQTDLSVRTLADKVYEIVVKRRIHNATQIQVELICHHEDLDVRKLPDALGYLVRTDRLLELVPRNPRAGIIGMANTYYVPVLS